MSKVGKTLMSIFLFFIILVLCYIYFFVPFTKMKTVILKDANHAVNNPFRGRYKQIASNEVMRLQELREDQQLILLEFDLLDFSETLLSYEKLQELEHFFKEAALLDKNIIFRAGYGFTSEVSDCEIMDLELLKKHIEQIAPVLNQYKSIILCVQAGFIGPWGEWHSSGLYQNKTEEEQKQIRVSVLQKLDEELDSDIILNVRRPSFMREAQNAGISIQRMGFHNDALLASETDMGTYKDGSREVELVWCEQNILSGINGGEMPQISDYTNTENVLKEFRQLKISYLNEYYNRDVWEQWQAISFGTESFSDYIVKKLGYRYCIARISYPEVLEKRILNPYYPLEITIRNEGFAPISEGFEVQILLEDENGYQITIPTHISLENIKGGEEETFQMQIPLEKGRIFEKSKISIEITKSNEIKHYAIELCQEDNQIVEGRNIILDETN